MARLGRLRAFAALMISGLLGFLGISIAVVAATSGATSGASAPVAPPAPITVSGGWLLQDAAAVTLSGDRVSSLAFQPPVYQPEPYRLPATAAANPPTSPGHNGEARPHASSEWTQGPGPPTTGWFRAVVPGTVLTTLVANEVYPEPLFGENNRPTIIPESLSRTSYWYRTTVLVPREFAGCRIWLTFDGINYAADIWVNGARVGDIRGAFARGRFDVTAGVMPGQPAAIAVLIHPPTVPADPLEQTQQWGLGLNGGVMSHDGPTFVSTQGWDWIPGIRDRDIGIWQRVTLSASGPVVVRDPYVTSVVAPDRSSADVTVETTVENATDAGVSGMVVGTFGTVAFRSDRLTIPAHGRRVVKLSPATTPQLHVVHPRLWWPNGFGEAYRYPLHLAFATDGRTSDAVDLRIGLRSVAYQFGESDALTLVVNGVPIFAQGGNWGMDEALKRIGRDRLDAAMRLQHDAHFTIVRNWVGQSTSEDFYDLADRYGLMVWDEFFQPAAGLDSGRRGGEDGERDVTDVGLYLANAREKVLRFRNHPSIVLWCGRNEGEPSPHAVASGLQAMMAELDAERLYQPNSDAGRGVKSGGPYAWQPPSAYFGEGRDGRAPLVPFKTEIGSVSIPTLESILGMMPAEDAESFPAIVNDDWAEHDFAIGGGNNAAGTYLADLAARYGDVRSLPRFVRAAQMANYEALRALFEGRVAQLFHPATAVITWMSHPAQPSTTWQLYSYDLEPFASYFGARKGCEPLHIQLDPRDGRLAIINHQPRLMDGLTYRVRVVDLGGRLILDRSAAAPSLAASAATDLGPIGAPANAPSVQLVRLELFDAGHAAVSDNFYWRNVAAENDLTALDLMPTVSVEAAIVRADRGGVVHLEVSLANRGGVVAVMTHLQLRRQTGGSRVLPVWYSDNYVSLLPGERRSVAIEAAVSALAGDTPLVTIDGWNVTTTRRSFASGGRSAVAPNDAAIVRPASAGGPR
jgi:hypothetical protein